MKSLKWCFEHQPEKVVYCREACIAGLLAIWVVNEQAVLALQTFRQSVRLLPGIDDNSDAWH